MVTASASETKTKPIILESALFAGIQVIKGMKRETGNLPVSLEELEMALDSETYSQFCAFLQEVSLSLNPEFGTKKVEKHDFRDYLDTDNLLGTTIRPDGSLQAVYPPRVFRDPEEDLKMVCSFGANTVEVTNDKYEFLVGGMFAELDSAEIKRTDENGNRVDFQLPVLTLIGKQCQYRIGFSVDDPETDFTAVKAVLRGGDPLAPMLKVMGAGGGAKFTALFNIPENAKDGMETTIDREFRVLSLTWLKPNKLGPSLLLELDPETLPDPMISENGDVVKTNQFYAGNKAKLKNYASNENVPKLWNRFIKEGKDVTLILRSAKKFSSGWSIDWDLLMRAPKTEWKQDQLALPASTTSEIPTKSAKPSDAVEVEATAVEEENTAVPVETPRIA